VVTEVVTEVVTDVLTEVVTEVVTDVVTEVVTEVVTDLLVQPVVCHERRVSHAVVSCNGCDSAGVDQVNLCILGREISNATFLIWQVQIWESRVVISDAGCHRGHASMMTHLRAHAELLGVDL